MASTLSKALGSVKNLDVQRGRPLRTLANKETVVPVLFVSILFFAWGFAYGLLDTMNTHVRQVMGLTRTSASFMAVGYYGAYALVPFLLAGPAVKHLRYRLTFILGLSLFGLGSFSVGGAASVGSFAGMVAGMFVIGAGMSTLERAANPYVATCGLDSTRELRLLLAQGVAGLGTAVAPFVAKVLLFDKAVKAEAASVLSTKENMAAIVGLYYGVGSIVFGIALVLLLVFFGTKLVPELPVDNESPKATEVSGAAAPKLTVLQRLGKLWDHPVRRNKLLWSAVVSNFFNMSCQVTVAQFFIEYCNVVAGSSHSQGSMFLSGAQGAFVLGRFAAAVIVLFAKPRYMLLLFILGAIGCASGAIFATKTAGIILAVMIMFFEGPSFPTIFATSTKGMGKHASKSENIMIASISGGGFLPPLFGLLADKKGTPFAFALVSASFDIVFLYPLAINVVTSFRKTVDARSEEETSQQGDEETGQGAELSDLP